MKQFVAKTVEEAVANAAAELGCDAEKLIYTVVEEKKGLFKKTATIATYDETDAAAFGEEYLTKALAALGVEATVTSVLEDDIIKMSIDSARNPILIGKGGSTLQALNELVKLAVSNKFRHRYRILLDVAGYKEDKYDRVVRIARKQAYQVIKTKVDCKLDPMTPDERRVVHNALAEFPNIKTESSGEGKNRAITIKYVA